MMSIPTRNSTRIRGDEGFTLMELLIVILLLGIISGIAIFAIGPFQRAATEACFDVEFAAVDVVEAARRAGMEVAENENPDCLPVALLFANAVENWDSVVTLSSQPQPGQTLVAISAHRGTNPTPFICSGDQYLPFSPGNSQCTASTAGWNLAGFQNVGSGSTGRGIAVWTKIVGANEPTVIRARWQGWDAAGSNSKSIIVGVFNRRLSVTNVGFNHSGTGGMVTGLDLGSVTGSGGPAVIVTALASRQASSGTGPCGPGVTQAPYNCVQFSGVSSIQKAAEQGSSVYTGMAWARVRDAGAGPFQASANWDNPHHAIGFTMTMNLFP